MGPLSGESRFHMEACTVKREGVFKVCLNDWLKHLSKQWPIEKEL